MYSSNIEGRTYNHDDEWPVLLFYVSKQGRLPEPERAYEYMLEELEELQKAAALYMENPTDENAAKMLKEMADVRFTMAGLALANKLNLDAAYVEVAQSNMTKERTISGKVRKGENYEPPRISPRGTSSFPV